MPKGMRATPAAYICVDCGFEGLAVMTGVVPFRCPPCKRKYKAAATARLRARDPEAAARYQRDYRHKKYGVGPLEYAAMVERAGGACEACGHATALQVDHCHNARKGRGMLCQACNKALGLLRDSPERCEALASYLRRFG